MMIPPGWWRLLCFRRYQSRLNRLWWFVRLGWRNSLLDQLWWFRRMPRWMSCWATNCWPRVKNLLLKWRPFVSRGKTDLRWCRSIPVEVGSQYLGDSYRSNSYRDCTQGWLQRLRQYFLYVLSNSLVFLCFKEKYCSPYVQIFGQPSDCHDLSVQV